VNVFEFVLLIVFGAMIFNLIKHRHDARYGVMRDVEGRIQRIDGGREAELEREVLELRERVKVLERIATDGRDTRLLSDEIEKLRDK
jgi:hypothetical protein